MAAVLQEKRTTWRTVDLLDGRADYAPAWEDFLGRHPKASVFHTEPMVRAFAGAARHRPIAMAAVTPDGEILSMLMAARVQTLPLIFGGVSSRSVWYAEPLCHDTPESIDSLCELIATHDRLAQRTTLFAEVRPLRACGPERIALERCGYEYLDYLNYLLDTTQPVELAWKRLHSSARGHVRRSQKRGFEFRHLDAAKSLDMLYEFLRMTYRRAGVPLADRTLFESACEILVPLGMLKCVAVYDGERPVAVDMMLIRDKQVFAWYGGSERMTGVSPAAFLQWSEIEWCCQNDIELFDFGGAGWPNVPYGVRDFKASFGGELVCYGRYRKVYSRWKLALAERAYEFRKAVISAK